MKLKPIINFSFELESTNASTTPQQKHHSTSSNIRRRIQTEQPSSQYMSPMTQSGGRFKPLPRTHYEYIKAKRDIDHSQKKQQERKQLRFSLQTPKKQMLEYDLKLAFIIRQQSFGSSKYLHKSSFEESIGSPNPRPQLDPIRESIEYDQGGFKQVGLGKRVINKDWENKWESLFETYFELEEIKTKLFQNYNDEVDQKQYSFITLEEIEYIQQQLKKPIQLRNYHQIDSYLKKANFISKFQKHIRYKVIEQGKIKQYTSNQKILSNSFNDQYVFIILRGSCKIQVQAHTANGKIVEFVIGSIYEGYHFSSQNLVFEKKIEDIKKLKKHELWIGQKVQYLNSAIYAQEDSYLLEISKDVYENILIKSITQELNSKISILKKVRILQDNNHEQLVPLAALLMIQKYKFGDLIINKGDPITKICILKSGEIKTCVCTRSVVHLQNIFVDQNQGQLYHYTQKPSSQKNIENQNKIKLNDKLMEFNKHIDVQKFQIGDLFGGSSILSDEEIKQINKFKTNAISQLSIVVTSPQAELLIMDSAQFESEPEVLQNGLKELISRQPEFDDVDIELITKQNQQWTNLKQGYVRSCAVMKKRIRSLSRSRQ